MLTGSQAAPPSIVNAYSRHQIRSNIRAQKCDSCERRRAPSWTPSRAGHTRMPRKLPRSCWPSRLPTRRPSACQGAGWCRSWPRCSIAVHHFIIWQCLLNLLHSGHAAASSAASWPSLPSCCAWTKQAFSTEATSLPEGAGAGPGASCGCLHHLTDDVRASALRPFCSHTLAFCPPTPLHWPSKHSSQPRRSLVQVLTRLHTCDGASDRL